MSAIFHPRAQGSNNGQGPPESHERPRKGSRWWALPLGLVVAGVAMVAAFTEIDDVNSGAMENPALEISVAVAEGAVALGGVLVAEKISRPERRED